MPGSANEDGADFEALAADAEHCAGRLTKTRDDPEAGFSDGDKTVLNRVLEDYARAGEHLSRQDAGAALPPEQDAYRTLRKFIDELHLKWYPPQTGQSAPQQTPERVRLQEEPQEPQMDEERLENRLKEMQKEIDALARQQQSLKSQTAKALQQEKTGQSSSQGSSSQGGEGQSSNGGPQEQQGSEQKTAPAMNERTAQDNQAKSKSQEAAAQQSGSPQPGDSSGQSGQSGQGQGRGSSGSSDTDAQGSVERGATPPGSSSSTAGAQSSETESSASAGAAAQGTADRDARLRMLQAKQQALREQATQLGAELGSLPVQEYSRRGSAQDQAQEHLRQAIETMKQFEEKLAEARYQPPASSESAQLGGLADSAARRLAEAGRVLQRAASGDEQQAADKAQEMADQLARDAAAYDESLSDADRQSMLERLAAAERLLESLAGPQWTTMSNGGGAGAGHVYTKDPHTTPAEAARLLARQFWSVALEARRREARPVEDEPSDVEFFEAENEFFESAARFRPERVEK
jgi:hypothetical protein